MRAALTSVIVDSSGGFEMPQSASNEVIWGALIKLERDTGDELAKVCGRLRKLEEERDTYKKVIRLLQGKDIDE